MVFEGKLVATIALLAACAVSAAGCGSEGIALPKTNADYGGALLFQQRCAGCHTLSVVGAEGSATSIKGRLRNQGPNFNVRKETVESVLYAIRNGGFSGQIMPQNVVTGREAQEVAEFLARYAGQKAPQVPSVEITAPAVSTARSATAQSGAAGAAGAGAPAMASRSAHR